MKRGNCSKRRINGIRLIQDDTFLSVNNYDSLTQRKASLVEFMHNSPLCRADDVQFERDQSLTREINPGHTQSA